MAIHMGDLLAGKYRVVGLLGQGGIGAVYRGIQEPLKRDVAIKTLLTESLSAEERAYRETRFFREAAICAQLQHPNTVIVYDYGELPDGELFLVMEFLEGQSLRQLQKQRGRLEPSLAIHIASQIAASLADAHAHGVIHRDLKPPNIMLVKRGANTHFVKVVDFGLVKDLSRESDEPALTRDDAIMGSPMYMAPERFLSKEFDAPAVDIYALGVMLYEMLTGRAPFELGAGSTIHQLVLDHVETPPPPLEAVAPDLVLPDGLVDLVMACLEKVPRNRPASMDVVYEHLSRVAASMRTADASASVRRVTTVDESAVVAPETQSPVDSDGSGFGGGVAIAGILGLGLAAAFAATFYAANADQEPVELGVDSGRSEPTHPTCDKEFSKFCPDLQPECLSRHKDALGADCQAMVPAPQKAPTIAEWLAGARAARVEVFCQLGEKIDLKGTSLGRLEAVDPGIVTIRQDQILGDTVFRCLAIGQTEVRGTAGSFLFEVAQPEDIAVDLSTCPAGASVSGRVLFGADGHPEKMALFTTDARANCASEQLKKKVISAAPFKRVGAFTED